MNLDELGLMTFSRVSERWNKECSYAYQQYKKHSKKFYLRRIDEVEIMSGGQLVYYGQDILLESYSEEAEFVKCVIDLSIITMEIVCKNVTVKEIDMKDISFLWNDENKKIL